MSDVSVCAGLVLALSLAASTAMAQPWRPLGPDQGPAQTLLADPHVAGRVYTASSGGVYRSDDAGRTWTAMGPIGHNAGYSVLRSFIADPDQPGRLYLIDSTARLLRSDDYAASWTPTGFAVSLADLDPTSVRPVVLADVPGSVGELLLLGGSNRIYRSSDGGASFNPYGYVAAQRPVISLALSPANPQSVLAGIGIGSNGAITGPTLMRSGNGGVSFYASVTGTPQIGEGSDIAFVGGSRVVAVLNGSIHASGDGGASWTPRLTIGMARVVASPLAASRLIATDGVDCYRSDTDFLDSTPCSSGLPAEAAGFSAAVAVRDGAAGFRVLINDHYVGVRAYAEGSDWAVSNAQLQAEPVRGLAIAPDGQQWFAGLVFGGNGASLALSRDSGQNWTSTLSDTLAQYIRAVAVDPTTGAGGNPLHLYAGGSRSSASGISQPTNGGIYKSLDGGVNWTALDQGLPPNTGSGGVYLSPVRKILLDPRSCTNPPATGNCRQGPLNTVYVMTSAQADTPRLLRSVEAGGNWLRIDNGLPSSTSDEDGYDIAWLADLDIDAGGDLYLSLYSSSASYVTLSRIPTVTTGVFKSSNGGTDWLPVRNGLPLITGSATTTRHVLAMAAHPRRSGVLWASTSEDGQAARIYKTSDGGASWNGSGAVLDGCDVRDLQVDSAAPEVIYAAGIALGSSHGCVFRSEDGGASWTALHQQLPVSAIYDLRQNPQDRRRLLLATTRGVWEGLLPSDRIFSDREN